MTMNSRRCRGAFLMSALLLLSSCAGNLPVVTTENSGGLTTAEEREEDLISSEGTIHSAPEEDNLLFFSSEEGADRFRTLYGAFTVDNGAIRTAKAENGDYSVLLFDTEDIGDFVAECDFMNHRGGGGIILRADGEKAGSGNSDAFCGYFAYIGKAGTLGAFGCSTKDGKWGGNFYVSSAPVTEPGTSLHLRILALGNYLVYTVTDKESGEVVFRYEYKIGDSKNDSLSALSGKVGLRLYNDGGIGSVENFVVRKLNFATDTFSLSQGQEFFADAVFEGTERISVLGYEGIGYSLCIDEDSDCVFLVRENGRKCSYFGRCALKIEKGKKYPVGISLSDEVCSFYFGNTVYPVFQVFFREENATVSASFSFDTRLKTAASAPEKTYTNPVADGADPEIWYEDDVYYLYTHVQGTVKVQTSSDLVSWSKGEVCYQPDPATSIKDFMSPNVFKSGDLYYLLIASRTYTLSDYRIRYATASSPKGPFIMASEKSYVNDVTEIGGAPFLDEDGRIYLTTVRFGGGNHIYLQEIRAENGVITPLTEAQKIIDPTEYYEIDDYGKISEGGVLIRHGGYYYLLYASGHYRGHYGEACAVSRNLFGPYEKVDYNEVLSFTGSTDGVGDCVFLSSPDGSELFVMYHRHKQIGNEGRERSICIDRVVFLPDEDGGPDVLRIVGPTVTPQAAPSAP